MKRRDRVCTRCRTKRTKSVTRICVACRRDDEGPTVALVNDGRMISFDGKTYPIGQARRLADAIHDTIEKENH